MLNNIQTISVYEHVRILTGQMLEAANIRDWEQMSALELRCSKYVTILKTEGFTEPLSGDLRKKKVQLIQEIMKNDRAIRDITHPFLNELSILINTMGTQRKLELSNTANDTLNNYDTPQS
ncbi:MAG: FliT flagellar protein [Pseudomonadota bacterium]|jgi:flagellar protein FliT